MPTRRKKTSVKSAEAALASIPAETALSDAHKNQWIVEGFIAQGRFNFIYSARLNKTGCRQYVAKIACRGDGPLLAEIKVLRRACKKDSIAKWKTKNYLLHLGVPRYVSSGNLDLPGHTPLQFLIVDYFPRSFESALKEGIVKPGNVVDVSLTVFRALKYLHYKGCAIADITASGLLYDGYLSQVTLVDFSRAHFFRSRHVHCPAKPNPMFEHKGTLEFCSRDSHASLPPSRRGDLEVFLFNLINWLARCHSGAKQTNSTGLPWSHLFAGSNFHQNMSKRVKVQVAELKEQAMKNVTSLISGAGYELDQNFISFAHTVSQLGYDETPDYTALYDHLLCLYVNMLHGFTKKSAPEQTSEVLIEQNCQPYSEMNTSEESVKRRKRRSGPISHKTSKIRRQCSRRASLDPDTTGVPFSE